MMEASYIDNQDYQSQLVDDSIVSSNSIPINVRTEHPVAILNSCSAAAGKPVMPSANASKPARQDTKKSRVITKVAISKKVMSYSPLRKVLVCHCPCQF